MAACFVKYTTLTFLHFHLTANSLLFKLISDIFKFVNSDILRPVEYMHSIIAKSLVQIIVFVSGVLNNLSNSSSNKNSTCLSSALIKSIADADMLLCHFFSKNFKKLLIVII